MTEYTDPEQQKAYDAEMARLETGEAPAAETTTESPAEGENQPPSAEQQLAEMQERMDKLDKALRDTKAFATKQSQEAARLREQLQANQVIPAPQQVENPEQVFEAVLVAAIPEINELLKDEEFSKAAFARRDELGPEQWKDPFVVVRELTAIQHQRDTRKAIEKEVAKVKKEAEEANKKLLAMHVPGGSGTRTTEQQTAEKAAQQVWDMPDAEFKAMQRRALGM